MATIAYHDTEARRGAKPPISVHPAFPAVVALWFAVLLGLGSLVLPAALLERASLATGLASLVPAAAPPLGLTARALVALAAAAVGALGGLALARRVAGLHAAETDGRFDEGLPRAALRSRDVQPREVRPLDIRHELGDDDFAPVHEPPLRRRALALAEDDPLPPLPAATSAQADDPWTAPDEAPFADDPAEEIAQVEEIEDVDETWQAESADAPVELDQVPAEAAAVEPPEEPAHVPAAAVIEEDSAMTDNPHFHAPVDDGFRDEAAGYDEAPADQPREPEPLPFAAPSLARRAPDPEPRAGEPASEPAAQPIAFRGDWTDTPLDRLGLVQLVERLGASLERRRARMAAAAEPAPAPVPAATLPAGFDAAPAEEAAQAMASYFGRPTAAPAVEAAREPAPEPGFEPAFEPAPAEPEPRPDFLKRFGALLGGVDDEDEEEEADWAAGLSLPLRKRARAGAADSTEDDDPAEERCGSLLAMTANAVRKSAEVVRLADTESAARRFDPPARESESEPAAPELSSAETDAALRKALAKLQRLHDGA